ncbi:hypothetical protein WICANDRAFT_34624 [Wickerhamomyces anomalus NRRL Y-366-8]|uniref:Major facilitator superfamily (MFS) profile domain-containing protein n=1 Tax=Wickerhamomyces anomalus (strain ATCC 58044 / CBS 1984 / NCYC 433 / NRRL Y-366-8) TaxID=683960 RepID=A0A1E3NY20_WICAA|nr:uncharacterized protein WICANDRAFT_34624 [Wickerhamomyces anomalus NRRL Y-366-8]ODQ58066.1 hypothetical protein WICANDRAFT_34624 [Wickerhamomyces anomalus NRRL Y-366-8]
MELKPTSSHAENSADSNDAGSNDAGEVVPFAHLSPDTQDVDEAMGVALDLEEKHLLWTPEKDKKLLLKIDLYMLPLICFLYACQYMDKTSNSYAAIMGLKTDLHMRGDMYSWTGTCFYLGYLVFEFPANYLLQRFPLAKTTSIFIFIWGALLCLHAVPNYAGFIALRTLLGVFESSISPAMVIITGQWYKKSEHFTRTTIWFCCNGFGIILGGLIAYGCAIHEPSYSVAGWKVLFIVTGLLTILISILFWFHIPDTPSKAWFLTDEEKLMVVERIRDNKQGFGNKHFKRYQFKESLLDPMTWLFFVLAIVSQIPNGAITNFGTILLADDFHYSETESLLMNCISGAVEIIGCLGIASSTIFIPHRLIISFIAIAITFMACSMLAFANSNKSARLAGYYLQSVSPIGIICVLSCLQSNTAGHTKKVTTTAMYFIGYCVGNLVGPQTFTVPPYTSGKLALVVCEALTLFMIAVIYVAYWIKNKIKEKKAKDIDLTKFNAIHNTEFADLTDHENPTFRYCL